MQIDWANVFWGYWTKFLVAASCQFRPKTFGFCCVTPGVRSLYYETYSNKFIEKILLFQKKFHPIVPWYKKWEWVMTNFLFLTVLCNFCDKSFLCMVRYLGIKFDAYVAKILDHISRDLKSDSWETQPLLTRSKWNVAEICGLKFFIIIWK